MNKLDLLFKERCINISKFAQSNGIAKTTLYSILNGKSSIEKVSISTWRAIAHGLGMSSDELYELVVEELD